MIIEVHYQDYPHRIKQANDTNYIFDFIRKKWLVLTPEEWVRQNFIHYLIHQLHYAQSSIAVEKKITLNGLTKRFDIVVFNNAAQPHILVECKRQNVPLTMDVAQQALNYLQVLNAEYLIITNGDTAMAWQIKPELQILTQLPVNK